LGAGHRRRYGRVGRPVAGLLRPVGD
jgi:hypothetical protein